MALYKYTNFVKLSKDAAFDDVAGAGMPAPRTGIYRCLGCGLERAFSGGSFLAEGDHRHNIAEGPVRWQLTVMVNPEG